MVRKIIFLLVIVTLVAMLGDTEQFKIRVRQLLQQSVTRRLRDALPESAAQAVDQIEEHVDPPAEELPAEPTLNSDKPEPAVPLPVTTPSKPDPAQLELRELGAKLHQLGRGQ